MYTYGITTSRCLLCYSLLSTNINPISSTINYSSSNRRHASRCSISSIEKLISSTKKFRKLWRKNENGTINYRSICCRCSDTIRQIEQIKINLEQLNHEHDLLMNKIEHYLHKRALIIQGQRQRNPQLSSSFFHQVVVCSLVVVGFFLLLALFFF